MRKEIDFNILKMSWFLTDGSGDQGWLTESTEEHRKYK